MRLPDALTDLCQVISILKDGYSASESDQTEDRRKQVLFGIKMCQQAFRRLLGIGSGRFRKLRKCAHEGESAPLDLRTLPKLRLAADRPKSINRQLIVEFLAELHATISEPMPEATGKKSGDKVNAFRRSHGKRPREAARIHRIIKSSPDDAMKNLRLVPPGSFTDYLGMLRARHPDRKISLKLFNSVPGTNRI